MMEEQGLCPGCDSYVPLLPDGRLKPHVIMHAYLGLVNCGGSYADPLYDKSSSTAVYPVCAWCGCEITGAAWSCAEFATTDSPPQFFHRKCLAAWAASPCLFEQCDA